MVEALESSDTDDESAHALKRLRPKEKGVGFQEVIRREQQERESKLYKNRCFHPVMGTKKKKSRQEGSHKKEVVLT